jgi:hypothetical protein
MTQVDRPSTSTATTAEPRPIETPPRRNRRDLVIALGLIALVVVLPLRGLLRSQGPPMEEGFMLVFPEMLLEGLLPNRDFLHLYGPGSLWVLAGVFETAGTSLLAERLVGLAQQLGIVLAVLSLSWRWNRVAAVLGAVITTVLIATPIGLTALAWVGAVALGLWAVRAALAAVEADDERRANRRAWVAGLLAGAALLYRPDLVVAVGLGGAGALWRTPRAVWGRALGGLAVASSGYLVHFATSGVGDSIRGMILDPVVYLRGGRRLPLPPSPTEVAGFLQKAGDTYLLWWPFPTLRTAGQLFAYFWLVLAAVALLVGAAVRVRRSEPGAARGRVLLAAALFCVGMLPQALQRPDSTHLAWVGCVPLGLLPIALYELLPRRRGRAPTPRAAVACAVAVAVVLVALVPNFTARNYADYTAQSLGHHRKAFEIRNAGRTFYYGRKGVADALPALFEDVERMTEPGDRLVVGTTDLRKTPYADSFLYYLLPDLTVGTYYVEMDPGVANEPGSGLADDIADADVVILSSVWDDWDEPNDSRVVGSDEPNQVLRRRFCLEETYEELFELYRRCR